VNESENPLSQKGFELFKTNKVKRLSPTQFLVRTETGVGSFLVELQDGKWICDCDLEMEECDHKFAARLATASVTYQDPEISDLKCRYCSSPDVSRCGFRYNARGIMRRYVCHDCLRKFSIPHLQNQVTGIPTEFGWLLNQGVLTSRLTQLLSDLNETIETVFGAKERI